MELKIIQEILNAQVLCGKDKLRREIFCACGSDLMSDVLRYAKEDIVLLTGLTNMHVIRTADLAGIDCIVFVRNKLPGADILKEAEELNMIVLRTQMPMYEACGRLYKEGLGDE